MVFTKHAQDWLDGEHAEAVWAGLGSLKRDRLDAHFPDSKHYAEAVDWLTSRGWRWGVKHPDTLVYKNED